MRKDLTRILSVGCAVGHSRFALPRRVALLSLGVLVLSLLAASSIPIGSSKPPVPAEPRQAAVSVTDVTNLSAR